MLFSKINLCHIPAFLCSWLSPTRYHLPQFFHSLFIIFFFIILIISLLGRGPSPFSLLSSSISPLSLSCFNPSYTPLFLSFFHPSLTPTRKQSTLTTFILFLTPEEATISYPYCCNYCLAVNFS